MDLFVGSIAFIPLDDTHQRFCRFITKEFQVPKMEGFLNRNHHAILGGGETSLT